ncbi:hypothetical protein [Hymenobacter arizonensis]|uniref:Antitoxin VbhA domain-containing protein n=1 Tax=Hymenobacter arizonensis TaxID=1227077 RepID=A0A1I5ZY27_HYMAR|nr:hypothetical protein [Hymenobacter arizonensis]SFQ61384.1 hypothetical protein SAMN04515668_3305 [Hymenobacter arizonensis]
MSTTPQFGPREKTRAQRQALMDRAEAWNTRQDRQLGSFAKELCQRYIAGDMSLPQVIAEVEHIHRSLYA